MHLIEFLPSIMAGLSAVGMSMAFLYAEPLSPATRSIATFFIANGLAQASSVFFYSPDPGLWFVSLSLVLTAVASGAFAEWLLNVARTAQATARTLTWITVCVRVIQLAAVSYVISGIAFPIEIVGFSEGNVDSIPGPVLWLFMVPLAAATAAFLFGGLLLSLQRVDPVERVRALAMVCAIPFLAIGMVLPVNSSAVSNLIGQLVFLIGAMRYHGLQGMRGQFMSKFLSPHVAELVRLKGLAYVLQPQSVQITVVCCDLRGFTRFSQTNASERTISLLNEYYEAVGTVVAEHGATIKDYAGDGILILVGAPLPVEDHASRGLRLAKQVLTAVQTALLRHTVTNGDLGVGVGVATGPVTVGAIGSAYRMEYTAVGSTVNLASRLCSLAMNGEILVDSRTAELVESKGLASRGSHPVKGMGDVHYFAVSHADVLPGNEP